MIESGEIPHLGEIAQRLPAGGGLALPRGEHVAQPESPVGADECRSELARGLVRRNLFSSLSGSQLMTSIARPISTSSNLNHFLTALITLLVPISGRQAKRGEDR
ncbi:MAG: hypothetical protein QOG64_2327 [Acidimicrobiaceae bacterium]|nr:hypothetical protein [Acidimicrobiaceae bacterium]